MLFSLNNNGSSPHANAEDPDICPHCHVANQPESLFYYHDTNLSKLISVWRCNFNKCKKIFVISHKNDHGTYIFERALNGLPKGPVWPEPILNLKDGQTIGSAEEKESKFIKTYLQSLESEANGHDEISGMGYRKAIEYLVKDWAIQTHPTAKEKILGQWLSAVIQEYFSGDLKDILERATWLGNDQIHYNKLFEDYNISHLKELISLIMVELDREFKKRHYIETIEKRK